MIQINVDLVFKAGSLAGLASFLWLLVKDLVGYTKRARLGITFTRALDTRTYTFADTGWQRKFITLHVRNNGKRTAQRCVAIIKFEKKPDSATHLEKEYALHWAGVPYTAQTTGAEPVDIGPEPRRLDVAFTHNGQPLEGSWLAISFALTTDLIKNQAYLPPGDYEVKIETRCENGSGDTKKLKITSPSQWDRLDVEEM